MNYLYLCIKHMNYLYFNIKPMIFMYFDIKPIIFVYVDIKPINFMYFELFSNKITKDRNQLGLAACRREPTPQQRGTIRNLGGHRQMKGSLLPATKENAPYIYIYIYIYK